MSLCIHRGNIRVMELPRHYNFFAPIPPLPCIWPDDTVLVHFIAFHRQYRNEGYRLWFDSRNLLLASGFLPTNIGMPDYIDCDK